ncbi:FadR/GntR family transcriptional regulator [Gordonia sp. (in: high G+C Gram-positive bacteria)]|uniref:FadR/GntR family transcriptional regulator n=1 Tax=unclassified Gordonia (in: high G+C Gram-positive bacteria) TaxID=2657482 RepID=UPI002610B402|nr:FCD domain-containing protein [Gordonia sp. (in: high G+C Gram-positive bacteria)]
MEPITVPPRTSTLVVDRMHQWIREGTWPVGSRIPAEPELVEQLGVGRNTVREAVRALEHAGLLVPRRGDGTYVRSRNVLTEAIARSAAESELMDLLSTRRAIESEAAALAALRVDDAALTELRELRGGAVAALARDDLDRHVEADIAFHRRLVDLSGNRLLTDLYDGIIEVIRRNHPALARATDGHRAQPDGHDLVLDALAAGDAAAARLAVHDYLDDAASGISR